MTRAREKDGKRFCVKCKTWKSLDRFAAAKQKDRNGKEYVVKRRQCLSCYKAWYKSYYERTKAHQKARALQYAKDNREAVNRRSRKYLRKLKLEFIEAYGGRCVSCGETDPLVLTMDHIHGLRGEKRVATHVELLRARKDKWPRGRIQLMCYNCNCSKGHFGSPACKLSPADREAAGLPAAP